MVCCCFPCAVYRDAEDLEQSGILCCLLSCLAPCLSVYFLRRRARDLFDIEVNLLYSVSQQVLDHFFSFTYRETPLEIALVLPVAQFVFNARLELNSSDEELVLT